MDDTGYEFEPYSDSTLEEVEMKGYDSGYADGVSDTSFEKGRGCIHQCKNAERCREIIRDKNSLIADLRAECDRFYSERSEDNA